MRTNKVIWSEGLFLRPQLFQQQERYLEYFSHKRAATITPFFWGFSRYSIDKEALAYGKFVLHSGSGVFPDGTPFDIPEHAAPPEPLTVRPEHLGQLIFLAVPLRLENSDETIFDAHDASSLARFCAFETPLNDANAIRQGPKPVQLGRLRLMLVPESEMTESWIGLPLARIRAIQPDGSVLLHENDYIPPVTCCAANTLLNEWVTHLNGLVKLRAEMLAGRLSNSDGKASASAEIVDYLLLQIFNKYEPVLDHLRHVPELPPIVLYQELAKFAGELSTFIRTKTRRPQPAPGYDHARLYTSIRPLVDDVHELLNQILIRAGQVIPLHAKGNGVWSAVVLPGELRTFASLVSAIHAGGATASVNSIKEEICKMQHGQAMPSATAVPFPTVPGMCPSMARQRPCREPAARAVPFTARQPFHPAQDRSLSTIIPPPGQATPRAVARPSPAAPAMYSSANHYADTFHLARQWRGNHPE